MITKLRTEYIEKFSTVKKLTSPITISPNVIMTRRETRSIKWGDLPDNAYLY